MNDLTQHVRSPSRGQTDNVLDLVITTMDNTVLSPPLADDYAFPIGFSNLYPLIFSIETHVNNEVKMKEILDWKKADLKNTAS